MGIVIRAAGFVALDGAVLDISPRMAISHYRVAQDIGVLARRINEIVHGTRRITADTALRLSRYFGTTERFWLNLQSRFDLEEQKDVLGTRLAKEVIVLRVAIGRRRSERARIFRDVPPELRKPGHVA